MDTKKTIIIILTILLISIIALGIYIYLSNTSELEYQNVNLTSTCSIDIPVSENITNKTFADNIMVLNDTQNDVLVASFNSATDPLSSVITDATQLASMRDSYKQNSEQLTIANETVWFNAATGNYMAFLGNDTTHDNILIVTKDNETLEHMIKSVKYLLSDSSNDEQVSTGSVISSNAKERSDGDLEFEDSDSDEVYVLDSNYESEDVIYSSSSSSDSGVSSDGGSSSGGGYSDGGSSSGDFSEV